jgi:hypothetical protein
MIDAMGRQVRLRRAAIRDVEARLGDIARRGRTPALIRDNSQTLALRSEAQNCLDEILSKGAVDPRRAQDDVLRIGGADSRARPLACCGHRH